MNRAEAIAYELKYQLQRGVEILPGASQHSEDLDCWREFFDNYSPGTLIELGTGNGVFSIWLSSIPTIKHFWTFDINIPEQKHKNFIQTDILNNSELIKSYISNRLYNPLLLYCDNGNKKLEVEIFNEYLLKDDFLAVHDYGVEIFPEDIPSNFKLLINKGLTAIFIND